jgi:hypothetical protein
VCRGINVTGQSADNNPPGRGQFVGQSFSELPIEGTRLAGSHNGQSRALGEVAETVEQSSGGIGSLPKLMTIHHMCSAMRLTKVIKFCSRGKAVMQKK